MVDYGSLVAMGFHVFDLWGVQGGVCGCGKPECAPGGEKATRAGKHPVRGGSFAAQSHSASHEGNLAIATGEVSNLWVVDIDPRNGGTEGWAALCAANGGSPKTLEVTTGSGGRHLYFDWPTQGEVWCSAGKLAPGVDVKGTGGYVVAPGSTHYTGGVYDWADQPEGTLIESAPEWLLALVTAEGRKPLERVSLDFPPATPLLLAAAEQCVSDWRTSSPTRAGNGHDDCVKVAAFLRSSWGLTYEEALPIAERHNALTFHPRGPDELAAILSNPPDNAGGDKRLAFEAAQVVRDARKKGRGAPNPLPEQPKAPLLRDVLRVKLSRSTHALVKQVLQGKALDKKGKHGGPRPKGGSNWTNVLTEISNMLAGEEWPASMLWDLIEPSWVAEIDAPEAPRPPREVLEQQLADLRASAVARLEAAEVAADQFKLQRALEILNSAGEPHDGGEWLAEHLDSKGNPAKYHDVALATDALRYSSAWKGVQLDTYTHKLLFRDELVSIDVLAPRFRQWLSAHGLPCPESVKDVIRSVAREDTTDTLRAYYDALPPHDGVDRLGAIDTRYLCTPEAGLFSREVCRRWLIALAARAYDPGAKVDNMLILQGTMQEERKSTFFECMPGYLNFRLGANEYEDARNLRGKHVVEFAELASLHKSTREDVKDFVTKRVDRERQMHANDPIENLRRCALCGTTNDDTFLSDPTGNRRFWPITVGAEIDFRAWREDLPKVLAQARDVYLAGAKHCAEHRCVEHRWWIDKEETLLHEAARSATKQFVDDDQVCEMIREALLAAKPLPSAITPTWVYLKVNALNMERTRRHTQRAVVDALVKLCGPARKWKDGKPSPRYYAPDPEKLGVSAPSAHLRVVPAEPGEASK